MFFVELPVTSKPNGLLAAVNPPG